jgi:hypothetical protein
MHSSDNACNCDAMYQASKQCRSDGLSSILNFELWNFEFCFQKNK